MATDRVSALKRTALFGELNENELRALADRAVEQRLARFLLDEARLRGRRAGKRVEFELALTNHQIAARIGTVREVVSRALSRLQQNELIVVNGRAVTIPDEETLRDFAGE